MAAWQITETTELDLAAWQVELVGTQRPSICGGASCEPSYTFVEAYLTQDRGSVIGIAMRELLPGDPLIPSST